MVLGYVFPGSEDCIAVFGLDKEEMIMDKKNKKKMDR